MNHSLFLNVMIILLSGVTIIVTNNPLGLFGLLLLQPMPFSLLVKDEPEEKATQIGFVHNED